MIKFMFIKFFLKKEIKEIIKEGKYFTKFIDHPEVQADQRLLFEYKARQDAYADCLSIITGNKKSYNYFKNKKGVKNG